MIELPNRNSSAVERQFIHSRLFNILMQGPLSPTEAPVLVRGNLHKLGKRLKGWHQRYFEVQGSHMYYYKNTTVSYICVKSLAYVLHCEHTECNPLFVKRCALIN